MKRSAILCLTIVFVLFITTIAFASIDDDLAKIKSAYESGNIDEFKKAVFTLYDNYIGKGQTKLIETAVKSGKYWSGSGTKNTEPFAISSTPWKIKWNSESDFLMISLSNAEDGEIIDILATITEKGTGETYVYEKGKFFLTITGGGSWEVEIEE
mgnify:FL=1